MNKYKCPYCDITKGSNGEFCSWDSVITHIRYCKKATGEFIIHKEQGPVHYKKLLDTPIEELKDIYGSTKLRDMQQKFKSLGYIDTNIYKKYSKDDVIKAIQQKAIVLGRTPTNFDFRKTEGKYPSIGYITKEFGSWLAALSAAGYRPEISELYGRPTIASDGHKYRSKVEADFVNKFLFNKYEYTIEPPYESGDYFYDWFIPTLDLYIELDGGVRAGIINTKIKINDSKNVHCLYVPYKQVYLTSNKTLQDLIDKENIYRETFNPRS
jgi:hypothetical protein